MGWMPEAPAVDQAALAVGICSLVVGVFALVVTVLLAVLQRHQPIPRRQRAGVAAAARAGIVLTAALTTVSLGVGALLVVTSLSEAAHPGASEAGADQGAATDTASAPAASPPEASPPEASAPEASAPEASAPSATTDTGQGLVDLPSAQAASRLVQVTEASLPVGAQAGDQPWPTMDGLCFQLGRGFHAWLPGQTEAWDGTKEGAAVLAARKIRAPGAAYTWSCTRDGEALTPADLTYSCATYYGDNYLAAVVDPDNAYSWVCRPRS